MIRFYNSPTTYLSADLIDYTPQIEFEYSFIKTQYTYSELRNLKSNYDRYFSKLTIVIDVSACATWFDYFSSNGLSNISIEVPDKSPLFLPHTSLESSSKYTCHIVNISIGDYVDDLYKKQEINLYVQLMNPTIDPLSISTDDSYMTAFLNRATPEIITYTTGGVYFPTNNKISDLKQTQLSVPTFRQASLTANMIKPFDAEKIMIWCQRTRTNQVLLSIPEKIFGAGGSWKYFIDGFYYQRQNNNFYAIQIILTQTP